MKIETNIEETHNCPSVDEAIALATEKLRGGYHRVWVAKRSETNISPSFESVKTEYWEVNCEVKHTNKPTPTPTQAQIHENITAKTK